jgi:GWxTD domain-containing protein
MIKKIFSRMLVPLCGEVFLLFLFFTIPLFSQVELSEDNSEIPESPAYFQDFLNFASHQAGKTRLDVFIQVPYTSIQFVKSGNDFVANYMVTVSIYDEDKEKLMQEKSWSESVKTSDFNQTQSKNNSNLSMKSFYLTPAKYYIRTYIEDQDSKRQTSSKNFYTVRDLSGTLSLSDIMLISKWSEVEKNRKIVPNISRNVAAQKGIEFFFEIYSEIPQKVQLKYSITDKKENVLFEDTQQKQLDTGTTQIFHTLNDTTLSLGGYVLTVNVLDSGKNNLFTISKSFLSRWSGVPSTVKDLDLAVDQMEYIASPKEIDYINDAKTQEEKSKRYLEYWKKKDPTPGTEDNPVFDEYYRRVAFANAKFSHYVDGWKTDRGMVYIILGPPNNVDRHPFDIDAKPYEVWEYYTLNKSFVFVDQTGFGDYRLTTPLYGDDYRYRY